MCCLKEIEMSDEPRKEPLYLVDGSGYIFRAFFAIAPLSNRAGLPTNAVYGFTRMLLKLLREESARYIAVAFDTGEPNFRHELYSEYKANRDECPADLVPQMPYFRKVVEALGIQSLEKVGFEADDVIATIATKLASSAQPVVIVSGDKDLTQLVNDSILVWDPMRSNRFTAQAVKDRFGVTPGQMVDYLSLVGDTSDNVPGVKGIGEKTAQKLLEFFGSVQQMVEQVEKIEEIPDLRGKQSVRAKIESSGEVLRLSRKLIELDCDVKPFSEFTNISDFEWKGIIEQGVSSLFSELEFTDLGNALKSAQNGLKATGLSSSNKKNFSVISEKTFPEFLRALSASQVFAFDTETSSLDVLTCDLLGISFSWKRGEGFYLPFGHTSEPERNLDFSKVREALKPIFADKEILKVGLNLKFDIGVLEEKGIPVSGVFFDAMLASYVCSPDSRQHGLKALAREYLQEEMTTFEQVLGGSESLVDVPLDSVGNYAAHDAEASWGLKEVLSKALREGEGESDVFRVDPSLEKVFYEIEMPLVPVLSRMERVGISVDTEFLKAYSLELQELLLELETSIYSLAGEQFNINSPKQLSEVLFEKLGISTAGVKRTQTYYSTDASVLQKLSSRHEIVEKLLVYRELFKLKSTYVDALQRLVHPITGRIHTSYNQAVAATGRLSSSEPNLQNIPIRTERGRKIRSAFVAKPGCVLIAADYSQIELRVLAHLASDRALQSAFQNNEDIHMATARELFGALHSEGEIKSLRRVAKTINFGIIYGMGAFRLAAELGISRAQAQKYIDDYFARYPGVNRFFEKLEAQKNSLGYVQTLFGRKRHSKDIEGVGRDSGYASRSLMNFPLQGTAAEIIKCAMIQIHAELRKLPCYAELVLQVHDELVLEVDAAHCEEVKSLVVERMENAVTLEVPLRVDVRVASTWGEEDE